MFAMAFDLDTALAKKLHPRGSQQAYGDIRTTLGRYGFERIQGSTYVASHEDHGQLFLALTALRRLPWFGGCLHDIRVFRMDQGTNFTAIMKTPE